MVTTKQKSVIDKHKDRKRNPDIALVTAIRSQEQRMKKKGRTKTYKCKSRTIDKTALTHPPTITLSVNGLNAPTGRHIG